MSRWDPSEDETRDLRPYDYGQAKRVLARMSADQLRAAEMNRDAGKDFAEAEEAYRLALREESNRLHVDEGVAWTAVKDMARGNKRVAELERKRNDAEAIKVYAEQVAWTASNNRKDAARLVDWSMRVAPDGEHPEGL